MKETLHQAKENLRRISLISLGREKKIPSPWNKNWVQQNRTENGLQKTKYIVQFKTSRKAWKARLIKFPEVDYEDRGGRKEIKD